MYCRRIPLANALKSFRSWVLMWVSFVTGVGINLSSLDSRFIWACVSSRFERFFMYHLFVSYFDLINIAPELFLLSWRLIVQMALLESLFPFKVIRRHKRHIGIRFTFFSLVFWRSNIICLRQRRRLIVWLFFRVTCWLCISLSK